MYLFLSVSKLTLDDSAYEFVESQWRKPAKASILLKYTSLF